MSGRIMTEKNARKQGLRMKELVEVTGLAKSTILFYVEKGLLPPPFKTSPNMAYYSRDSVERLAKIKELQARTGYPLERIKQILAREDEGVDISCYLELDHAVFGPGQGRLLDAKEFSTATGLSPEEVEEHLGAGVLLPLTPGRYDQRDVAMGIQFARGLKRGLRARDKEFYARLGKEIVDHEMALRARVTAELPEAEDIAATLDLMRAARSLRAYVIERLFQLRVAKAKGLKDQGLVS